jgi:hypothetical protein
MKYFLILFLFICFGLVGQDANIIVLMLEETKLLKADYDHYVAAKAVWEEDRQYIVQYHIRKDKKMCDMEFNKEFTAAQLVPCVKFSSTTSWTANTCHLTSAGILTCD